MRLKPLPQCWPAAFRDQISPWTLAVALGPRRYIHSLLHLGVASGAYLLLDRNVGSVHSSAQTAKRKRRKRAGSVLINPEWRGVTVTVPVKVMPQDAPAIRGVVVVKQRRRKRVKPVIH